MTAKYITIETEGAVTIVTLARAHVRNAINEEVCAQLRDAWQRLAISDDRVAILTGAPRHGSSGSR